VGKAIRDRCVQMEKMTDTGVCLRKRQTLTLSPAGLVEDIFLKDRLLLHGGKGVIIIL
jgi:hypothetical protein